MKVSTIRHFTVDASKSLIRNKTLSIASIATVATTLFILGIFLLGVFNVDQGIKKIGSQFEVKVYMKDDISIKDKKVLAMKINKMEGIAEVKEETKKDALEKFKEMVGDDEKYKNVIEDFKRNNPLPESYIIRVKKPENVDTVVNELTGEAGVEKIQSAKDLVERVVNITNSIKWAGLAIFILLFFVSLFLIMNTIKLTVFSRKREIGIMKYVGATDWFIRWPFIIEGIIIGLLGSLLATGVLYYVYKLIVSKISNDLFMFAMIEPMYILKTLLWQFTLGGVIIGIFGSIISVRKFLKV